MDSSEVLNPHKIKEKLIHTWQPFFGRFGNFTPIQELTIPHVLDGKNVVVISPAASGKTESVVAPMIENLIQRGAFDPAARLMIILYISPTRALVNDLYRRLYDPMAHLKIEIGRKIGDRPKIDIKNPPQVLLTTPESFDSLLTRQPRIFLNLEAVVLDEIHLLDNTPRGDQLRILLNRLRRLRDKLQYCILSATIDDLDIGKRYFPDPQVCFLRTPREIEYMLMPHKDFIVKLLALAKERNWKKILAFFNARSHVETFSQGFNRPPFQDRVLVHHASLPKEQREVTEKIMNQSNQAILCATSTLELGIDIGDVDCVVLYRPPFDVSSLLQRIGRGNRRLNSMYAVGVYTNKWERMLFETLFESARQGSLYSKNYQPSLSVIPQQIYSYLYQRRRLGTTLKSLCRILVPPYTEGDVKSIFRKLVSDSCLIEFRPGIYFTGPALEKRITYGKIHSNIAEVSFGEYDVFDTAQGNRIGRVFHLQNIFILGGRCWQIVKILEKEKRVYAQYLRQAPGVAKIFEGKGAGSYHYLMAPVLKGKLFPELAGNEFPSARDGFNTYILHLFGWLNGFLLTEGLVKEGFEALDIEGKILNLHNFPLTEDKFPFPRSETIKTVIQDNITMLEDALGSGAFFYDLPTEHQIHDHYLGMDIDNFLTFLTRVKLREYPLAEFQKRIAVIK